MEEWKILLRNSIRTPEELAKHLDIKVEDVKKVSAEFPFCINSYYLNLIKKVGDGIWKQAIPDIEELDSTGEDDPLSEEKHSPIPGITHRYPDRVLFYVSPICAMYCRFCTRKRKVSHTNSVSDKTIEQGFEYIRNHSEIRDVIVSGGDPLMLTDDKIDWILSSIRAVPHVEIVRLGTRAPITLPQRITDNLCNILKKYHPLYIQTHFNSPDEITPESTEACRRLADAGLPINNQSVLLKGVNDDPVVMKTLLQRLLKIRVRPYLIFQCDMVKGTDHFRTSVETGLKIIKALRGFTSGLAVPHYVIDAPGGGGKIALIPNPIVYKDKHTMILQNFEGVRLSYETTEGRSTRFDKKRILEQTENLLPI